MGFGLRHDFVYFGVSAEDCDNYRLLRRETKAHTGSSEVDPEVARQFVTQKGNAGVDIADPSLKILNRKLSSLIVEIDEDETQQKRSRRHALDNLAAPIVFQELNDLPMMILNDTMFWRYAAVHALYDVVDWCYPQNNGARWGANPTQNIRNVVYSWFVRGQLCQNYSPSQLEIVNRVGDIDIWTSHVIAVLHGSSPVVMIEFFRKCVEWQNPNGSYGKVARLAVRDLAKQLKELRSNYVFDVIDEESASEIVNRLSIVSQRNAELAISSGSMADEGEVEV